MFGDFLHPDKHRALTGDALSCLEDGTPVVARYNARHFRFSIYGNGHVIYQDCQSLTNQVLVFSIKKIPAHHLLAIEEGYAVHFSKGGGNGFPQIIVEDLQTIGRRADTPLINVAYNKEDVISRLLARNRALLVYSGKVSYNSYHLFANNCEHFVHLCKTGHPYSSQVRDFFTDATLVCLSLLARKPHMAAMVLAKRLGWMGVR